ncbi:MAG: tetratricopeptide repeat protein [Bacteroidales bacterium]|nr:tetratricopeptide repeat protein [Bacteroidales bacterium]
MFKKKILLFIILCVGSFSYAQSKYEILSLPDTVLTAPQIVRFIDKQTLGTSLSGINLFAKINDELTKATLRNDSLEMMLAHYYLARLYAFDGNYSESSKNYQSALNVLNKEKYPELEGVFYGRIGISLENMFDYDNALIYFNKSLKIREKIEDTVGIINVHNFIGRLYKKLGKYDLAFECFTKALNAISDSSKLELKAFTYVNLGLIFSETGDYIYAEKYLNDALEIRKKLNNEIYVAHTYFRLADLFLKKADFDRAIEYSLKAMSIYDKNSIKKQLPEVYNFLGLCYLKKGKYEKANRFLSNAKQLALQNNSKYVLARNALNFGTFYALHKDYKTAIMHFKEAINRAEELQRSSLLAEANKKIAKAYFETGQFKEAYLAKETYEQLHKNMFNTDFAKKVADFASMKKLEKLSLIYEFERKEEDIKKAAEIHREILLRNVFIAVSLFFILFAFILFYQIKQKSKINRDLKTSKELIEKKQSQIVKQRDVLIKQKKELTDTLNNVILLKKAIEQSSSTIVITDAKGNIEYVNPKFVETTGYTFEEVKGENPRILSSGKKSEAFYKELWNTILSGKEWRGEFVNKRKDGKTFTEYASISSVKDDKGQIIHFVAVKDDVTEQQKILSELEKLTAVQTKVFSIIGHDLRSPLGSVKSILEFLIEKDYVQENDELSRIMGMILKSIVSISFLSENLLNWGANWLKDNDPLQKEFIINELIDENLSILQNAAVGKNIILSSELTPKISVYADPEMISIVIRNLIANAIKFTPVGGKITIYGQKITDDKVEISVKDTGVGIKKETIPLLLDEYNLFTTPGTESEKGSGLGLSICVQFIKRNNGHFDIESVVGKGSVFKFTLPIRSGKKSKVSNSKLESTQETT